MQLLISCETLLRSVGELFWAKKIETALKKYGQYSDGCMLEEIISWYGGMGSFNDLIISVHNSHSLGGRDEYELNDELHKIRSKIYQEAVRLNRSL
ncbi:MAG: hypothetical protein Q8Q45_07680 [Methylococcaceae bacterium]|uniref:DUF6966 domain-containing protein n=1 Tax=Methylicorpusculum sp. TaxID=2713644 RepID=UPI00276AB43C|nr:hypothetical protein [Methylicorpusculum sp.]MDP3389235.1 hypothetical protein [Methylococcaceae bacterium]MDP3932218.1 hypothetical protein [Methylococcaceae bacterium]MDZ4152554.1 hypothetical protein [Methylicorpusculum sp.]